MPSQTQLANKSAICFTFDVKLKLVDLSKCGKFLNSLQFNFVTVLFSFLEKAMETL